MPCSISQDTSPLPPLVQERSTDVAVIFAADNAVGIKQDAGVEKLKGPAHALSLPTPQCALT